MAAAHGDPLRQSQRRSGRGNSRGDVYPIDFQAYQMGPTCGSGCHCPSAEEPSLGPAEETSSGVAVVSGDASFRSTRESDKETAQIFRVSFQSRIAHLLNRQMEIAITPEY